MAAVSPDEVVIPPNWPDNQTTREDYADYLTTVEQADAVAGEVLKALKESGRAENTIVVYTADHGEMMSEHGAWTKGMTGYDAKIRVPMIISYCKLSTWLPIPNTWPHLSDCCQYFRTGKKPPERLNRSNRQEVQRNKNVRSTEIIPKHYDQEKNGIYK